MAIGDKNQPQQPGPGAGAGPAQNAGAAFKTNTEHGQEQSGSWNFGGGLFAAPIGRGVGSEYTTKLFDELAKIYENCDKQYEITLLKLDNNEEMALAFSSILVCMNLAGARNKVAALPLLLESTGDPISPQIENIANQQVEILRVAGDALDQVFSKKAVDRLSRAFPKAEVIMLEGVVVPTTFQMDNKADLHAIALNAGLACGTELMISKEGFTDFSLASVGRDQSLVVNVGFNRQELKDAVGLPMRSDVLINFSSQKQVQVRNASLNSGDREMRLTELSGYIDLVWDPVAPANPMGMYYQPQGPQATQKYAARFIMTNLASEFSFTPASVLLALATAFAVSNENNWVQTFRPSNLNPNEIDLHDIGAMNIEANLMNEQDRNGFGTRIDTKVDSFKLSDLGQLVSALVRPGLIMSLDCPETGPQSWYLSVFAAAAAGNTGAITRIVDAANALTGGRFSAHFNANSGPMFVDLNNRVHLGYWIDKNGMKRDIRDIDSVAIANLVGDREPKYIADWSDTFLRTQYDLAVRLAARKKMIMAVTNESAVFTGYAQRVTLSDAFMSALGRAIAETGVMMRINTPLSSADFQNQRGIGTFAGSALLSGNQSFLASGWGARPNQYTAGPMGQYRF